MSDTLTRLYATIISRKGDDPARSHTAALLAGGTEKCARKFGEEALEVIIEALKNDQDRLISEAADSVYHLMVLLAASGVDWQEVLGELERREGTSGLAEKAARSL